MQSESIVVAVWESAERILQCGSLGCYICLKRIMSFPFVGINFSFLLSLRENAMLSHPFFKD